MESRDSARWFAEFSGNQGGKFMKRTCEKISGQIRDEAAKLQRELSKLPDGDAPGLDTAGLHLRNAAASLRAATLAIEGAALTTNQTPTNAVSADDGIGTDDDAA
jgi:hypothetical protein